VCDLETSRMGAPYIYIYDISRLRVNQIVVVMGPVNATGMFPSCHRSSGAETHNFDAADDKDGSRLPAKRTQL